MTSFLALVATRLPDPVNMKASGVKISCRNLHRVMPEWKDVEFQSSSVAQIACN